MMMKKGLVSVFAVAIFLAYAFQTLMMGEIMRDANNGRLDGEQDAMGQPEQRLTLPQQSLSLNDPAAAMNAIRAPEYHVVVSTGCSTRQDWQSYAGFFHTVKSGQVRLDTEEGLTYVTRVVSGCNEEEQEKMNAIFEKEIAPIAPGRFFIHYTPSYEFIKPNVTYKYFNKAFGIQHWLVNCLRYPYNREKYDNVTYILLDPDQIIVRPFQNDFKTEREIWSTPDKGRRVVQRGQPFAQAYDLGYHNMLEVDMARIAPKNELPSPVSNFTIEDSMAYQIGPPYILKGFDMWRLVNKWADFNPYVYDQIPLHISEMFGYTIAAAHLNLTHQVAESFMVSSIGTTGKEGWPLFLESLNDYGCDAASRNDLPHTFHYCQEYGVGKHFFSKFRLPEDFISCDSPLLKEPPRNVASLYNFFIRPRHPTRRKYFTDPDQPRKSAFAVCYMIKAMNEAATHFKEHNCKQANFNQTLTFFANMEVEDSH